MPLQKWSDQIWVSQMSPEPSFSDEIEALSSQFAKAQEKPHVVIDLAGVSALNSSNLAQLLNIRKQVNAEERRLRIAGPSNSVWSLFLTTGLDKVFEFSSDTATALAELQMED